MHQGRHANVGIGRVVVGVDQGFARQGEFMHPRRQRAVAHGVQHQEDAVEVALGKAAPMVGEASGRSPFDERGRRAGANHRQARTGG